jgi:hypothetical protein
LLPLIANTAGVAATCDNIGAQHALTPLVNVFDMSSIASFLPSVDLTITLHDTLTTLTGFLLLSLQWLRSTTSRLDFSLPNFGLNIYVECIEPEPPPSSPLQCWWWFWFYYYHFLQLGHKMGLLIPHYCHARYVTLHLVAMLVSSSSTWTVWLHCVLFV